MQVHRTIDQVHGIVYTTITGEISLADVRADMTRLADEPSYDPQMPGIVDMRRATTNLSVDEMVTLTQLIQNSPRAVNCTRRALLVSTELMYGIYRVFESLTQQGTVEYRVFKDDEKEALKWIQET